jgi:two-component system, OmpR family, phosphate regulon sensor histidine kinase PhoR
MSIGTPTKEELQGGLQGRSVAQPQVTVVAPARRSWRDILVSAGLAGGVLSLLASSGTLGWVEAITAFIVFSLAVSAYGVATVPPSAERPGRRVDTVEPAGERPRISEVLGALVSELPQPAFIVGADGRVIAVNESARQLFRAGNARSLPLTALVRRPELVRIVEACLENGRSDEIELVFSDVTDTVGLARAARLPLPGPSRVLVTFEDRTAIRRAEATRSDFLANASHELRTPLTALAGYIETMRGSARDDPASWDRFLGTMYDQTERMRRLIDDLQSLSRVEHHQHRVPDSVVDLSLIVREVIETLEPVASRQGMELSFDGPDEGLLAVASRDEMFQVVQNLVTNAIKYSGGSGCVGISIGASTDSDAARSACGRQWLDADRIAIVKPRELPGRSFAWVRVSDSGNGLPASSLPRLGERFYRVDESRGGKVKGTGLGLAIVKHIMARHRGGLNVESREGQGAAFGVWLPQPESSRIEALRAAE